MSVVLQVVPFNGAGTHRHARCKTLMHATLWKQKTEHHGGHCECHVFKRESRACLHVLPYCSKGALKFRYLFSGGIQGLYCNYVFHVQIALLA
jgi:hypothetical protein